MESEKIEKSLKPAIVINSIKFNDGTELRLNENSIVVFTGGNNSGKSQTLKDVDNILANKSKGVV